MKKTKELVAEQSLVIEELQDFVEEARVSSRNKVCSKILSDFSVLNEEFSRIRQNGERLELKNALAKAMEEIKRLERTLIYERSEQASRESNLLNKIEVLESIIKHNEKKREESKPPSMKILEEKYVRLSHAYESLLLRNKELTKSLLQDSIQANQPLVRSCVGTLELKQSSSSELGKTTRNEQKENEKPNVKFLVSSESQTEAILKEAKGNSKGQHHKDSRFLRTSRPKSIDFLETKPNWDCASCQKHHAKERKSTGPKTTLSFLKSLQKPSESFFKDEDTPSFSKMKRF